MAIKHDEVSVALMECAQLRVDVPQDLEASRVVRLLLRLFDAFPALTPARFNPFDPVRTPYTRQAFEQLVQHEHIDRHLMLRGPGKRGALAHSLQRMAGTGREAWIYHFDLKVVSWNAIEGAADIITELPISLASLHVVSATERVFCKQVGAGEDHCGGFSFHMQSPGRLAFGLPTLAWRTYFGPMYIRHFGKERLLSAPAYAVREVHPDVISIQLTESINAIDTDWDRFHATRQAVIAHLGAESFQRVRGPSDPPSMGELDRNGVPGTSIPSELVPLRKQLEEQFERERLPKPPAIQSLDEMVADAKRFRVVELKSGKKDASIVVVDTAREEMIGFADDAMRDEYVKKLLHAGAEFKKLG
ncbi:MAG: hypothetical protein H7144_01855 [Burkholderiales bacterium]|nr:hypothetical protein [Phycisphaerae bacterium]